MQHYEESHLILSPALTGEEEQRQRRLQARRESRRSRLEQETPQQLQARLTAVREPVALCSGGSSWSPLLLISSWSGVRAQGLHLGHQVWANVLVHHELVAVAGLPGQFRCQHSRGCYALAM